MSKQRNQLDEKDADSGNYQERVFILDKDLQNVLAKVERLRKQSIVDNDLPDGVRQALAPHNAFQ